MTSPKVDVWMPLYVADYLADTTRLTTEQHGAYLLLLMDYWRNGPPPDNDAVLAQITRMSPDAWSNARSILQAFFKQVDGTWTHGRVEAELAKAAENKEKFNHRAKAAADARWNATRNASSNASSNARAMLEDMLEECPSPSPSPSPSTTPASPPSPPPAKRVRSAKVAVSGDDEALNTRRAVFENYSDAYADRYGVAPLRNAKTNALIAQFCKLVPAGEAPSVAAHYVGHNGAYYVAKMHPLELLVTDANKLRTEWATGIAMTSTRARQQDRTSSMLAIVEEIKRERGEA